MLMHTLLVAPLCRACTHVVRGVQAQDQTVNKGREATEQKNVPPLPMSKRGNKKADEEQQCKNKKLDHEKKTGINIRASSQGGRELWDLRRRRVGWFSGQIRTPA